MTLRTRFLAFDDALASHGVPPCSAWWRKGIGAWLDDYERRQVLELTACVGRGAAKSTAMYKLALFFTLFGAFLMPPGERHFAVVLSRLKEEAAKGIAIIAAWLRILAIPHHVAGDVIEIDEQPRGIRVVAASVAASSGWRAFFVAKDERSKWASGGVEELDAGEVDTSASAMTATHPLAPVLSFGSAWGAFGEFYDAVQAGSDDARVVLGPAPTWVAAPHISEESCRKKERDPRRFAREYRCDFQAAALAVFDQDDVDAAFQPRGDCTRLGAPVVVIDASSGRKDRFSFAIAGFVQAPLSIGESPSPVTLAIDDELPMLASLEDLRALLGEDDTVGSIAAAPILRFEVVDGFDADIARRLGSAGIVERIAKVARKHGANVVHGDQREAFTLADAFRAQKLKFRSHDWTASSKPQAVEIARRWFRERTLALPQHEPLRRELLSFEERIAPSGAFTFGARGNGHDDYVALILTAALANLEGGLKGARHRAPLTVTPEIRTYTSAFD